MNKFAKIGHVILLFVNPQFRRHWCYDDIYSNQIETVVNASEIVRNDNVNSKVYLLFLRAPMSTELGKALSRSNKTKNEDFSRLTLVLPFLIEIRIIINEVLLVRDEPFGLYGIYHVINQVYIPVNLLIS